MSFLESVFAKLERHPKRIVFTDGDDPRVLHAAEQLYARRAAIPVLLGDKERIRDRASTLGVSLDHTAVIEPAKSDELPAFSARIEKLERYRKMGIDDAGALMSHPNYFGAMMIQYGLADALVGGISGSSGSLLRPLIRLVKPWPYSTLVSGCLLVQMPSRDGGVDEVYFLADCGVVPDPDMQQLAAIAVQTGLVARHVFGTRPRVALLSFSTKGSARTASTEKVSGAVVLARQLADQVGAEIAVDGEMQADAALVPEIAGKKMGASLVAGKANVLIFPELNSGNISAKLLQHFAGAKLYGQILLGLSRPAADLSRGATSEEVLAVAGLVGLQAIEYRKLYPAPEFPS